MKKMRKIVTLVLALAMSLSLIGCGGSDVVGYWVIDQVTLEGKEYTVDELKDLGLDMNSTYLVFEEGGTGYLSIWGEE